MKLKLDENLSRHLKVPLEQLGHDPLTTADEGLLGKSDVEVGAAATADGRLLLTLDLEFADLRKFAPGTHAGVIVFRPSSMGPNTVSQEVLAFARESDVTALVGCVAIVEPGRVRVRRPALDTSGPDWRDAGANADAHGPPA